MPMSAPSAILHFLKSNRETRRGSRFASVRTSRLLSKIDLQELSSTPFRIDANELFVYFNC